MDSRVPRGGGTGPGRQPRQWWRSWPGCSPWFVDAGSGNYKLRARHSGKLADVLGASTADGAGIVQQTGSTANDQQWQLVQVDSSASGSCTLPSTYRWSSTGPLANPKSGWVALTVPAIEASTTIALRSRTAEPVPLRTICCSR